MSNETRKTMGEQVTDIVKKWGPASDAEWLLVQRCPQCRGTGLFPLPAVHGMASMGPAPEPCTHPGCRGGVVTDRTFTTTEELKAFVNGPDVK